MTTNSNNPLEATLSNQIYLSRDQIRTQIVDYMKYYLELENVDLVKSSFLSFLVDTISTLTANLFFYSVSTYKEFFLTKAQIPESIYNLSAFLGYNPVEAKYATANVLFTIPLGFDEDVSFLLSDPDNPDEDKRFNFIAKTGNGTEFTTYYKTAITVRQNSYITVTVIEDLIKTYNLPVSIDTTSSEPSFSFLLPMKQYSTVTQEFPVDPDTPLYQFVTVDVPLPGTVSSMIVTVTRQGDSGTEEIDTYTEIPSVYLMAPTDRKYVSRNITLGRRLVFGNGLIGWQPEPGSTITVSAKITKGYTGNVIAGSIKTGNKIYVRTSDGQLKDIKYYLTNPSPATGGKDEESTEEIRSNSIANLVTLHRLVSEYDYQHAGVVVPESPIVDKTIPVLKRSDVKCNEIQLYSILEFGTRERLDAITGETVVDNIIVPTRNLYYTIPLYGNLYIPRGTVIEFEDHEYYTLFDVRVDTINAYGYYDYVMYEIALTPLLSTSYGYAYNFVCTNLIVKKDEILDTVTFDLYYQTSEGDYENCNAILCIENTALQYDMINDVINKKFTYTFNPYTLFPEGTIIVKYKISNGLGIDKVSISDYETELTVRKSLSSFMMSNVSIDSTSVIIYDIPVVEKTYYDSIVKKDFELNILQNMLNEVDFKNHRMLTDFTNFKLTNTIGTMTNMKYNPVTKSDVTDIGNITIPTHYNVGDRYIIGYTDTGSWSQKNSLIAQCISETGDPEVDWYYFTPITDDIVYVTNKGKKFIYNGYKWVLMEYACPLEIVVEVFKSPDYYGSDITLANLVKSTLLTVFSPRFGPNISLYKSEIIRTIQNIEGVGHCNLIKPESNIFFEYELTSLTEQELLEYSPEFIYFLESSIIVKVYAQ